MCRVNTFDVALSATSFFALRGAPRYERPATEGSEFDVMVMHNFDVD
jgi:hypothetical protein